MIYQPENIGAQRWAERRLTDWLAQFCSLQDFMLDVMGDVALYLPLTGEIVPVRDNPNYGE